MPLQREKPTLVQRAIPVAAIIAAFLGLLSWGLSSAPGSSPDDDFHMASIWCSHGTQADICEPGEGAQSRNISELFGTSVCFAFQPDRSASCQGETLSFEGSRLVDSERGNFSGDYPPIYYWTLGNFTSSNFETSLLTLRITNIVVLLGMIITAFWMSKPRLRLSLLWGLIGSSIPLAMFIIPSTNPSSWALASIAVLWVSVMGYFSNHGAKQISFLFLVVLATTIGAGARADAALFAVMSISIAAYLSFEKSKAFLWKSLPLLGVIALAAILFLSAQQSSAATNGVDAGTGSNTMTPLVLFIANLVEVPSLWAGSFGTWGLGWLDTSMPGTVWVLSGGVFAGLIFIGLTNTWHRKNISLLIIAAVAWGLPAFMLVQSNATVGAYVQPRYILPILVLGLGIALLSRKGDNFNFNRSHALTIAISLTIANSFGLHTNIRRYVSGADNATWNLDANIQWWWSIPLSPMHIWILGTVSFAVLMLFITPKLLPGKFSLLK